MLEGKKVDIFKEASRDFEREEIEAAIDKITDGDKNPGALFPERISKNAGVTVGASAVVEKRGKPMTLDEIMDSVGGKLIDPETGKDTGYRTPKQKEAEKLKSLLDAPEPEKEPKNAPEAPEEPKNAILEAALEYAKDGKSVIPVAKNKVPLINWKEFHSRIATEDEIRGWWQKWPEAQLGMVTGKISDIAVVDVEKEFGDYAKLGLPETTVSRTGSGGFHLFYGYVDGVKNKAKINNQEVDIRGEGGYVIVPPSSNENGEYKWLKKVDKIPGFPVNIIPPEKPVERGEYESTLDYNVKSYPGFGEGQRNNEMAKFAGALLARLHPDFWDDIGWPMYQAANEKNDPPLPHHELEKTWSSICQAEETQSLERWQERNRRTEREERLEMLDKIEGDDIVTLEKAADRIRALNPQTYPTGFAVFDNAMKGGFKEGDLVVVTGMSGHGKTTLGQTFTYHMIQKELPVLWFSYEVSADILDDKFKAMGVSKDYKAYVPEVTATGDMIWVEKKIKEAIDRFKIKCVFIDLIDFLSPADRKPSDNEVLVLKRVTTELKNIARENRVVMFVMAHVRKQKDTKKGLELQDIAHSSSIVQLSDYVFAIERVPLRNTSRGGERMKDPISGEEIEARKNIEYSTMSSIRIMKNRYTGMMALEYCRLHSDERFHTDAPSVNRPVESPDYFHK